MCLIDKTINMKKLFALILLVLFAVACSDVNEDVIPDPVTPEVQVDNSQGAKSDNGSNGGKKPRNKKEKIKSK